MEITLNDAEQRLASYLAKCRYENARNKGIEDKKIGDQSNEFTDLEGIGAEIAFCKAFNLYPDLEVGHIPLFDAYTRLGHSVDVKSTKYRKGHLLATLKKIENPADLYALIVGEMPRYRFVGLATPEQLFQSENIKDLGHGKGYVFPQERLYYPKDREWLLDYVNAQT